MQKHADRAPRRELEETPQLFGCCRPVCDVCEENGTERRTAFAETSHMHERRSSDVQRDPIHDRHTTARVKRWILGEPPGRCSLVAACCLLRPLVSCCWFEARGALCVLRRSPFRVSLSECEIGPRNPSRLAPLAAAWSERPQQAAGGKQRVAKLATRYCQLATRVLTRGGWRSGGARSRSRCRVSFGSARGGIRSCGGSR
jgi:hypothetical protein